jgi:hypothetical protein
MDVGGRNGTEEQEAEQTAEGDPALPSVSLLQLPHNLAGRVIKHCCVVKLYARFLARRLEAGRFAATSRSEALWFSCRSGAVVRPGRTQSGERS